MRGAHLIVWGWVRPWRKLRGRPQRLMIGMPAHARGQTTMWRHRQPLNPTETMVSAALHWPRGPESETSCEAMSILGCVVRSVPCRGPQLRKECASVDTGPVHASTRPLNPEPCKARTCNAASRAPCRAAGRCPRPRAPGLGAARTGTWAHVEDTFRVYTLPSTPFCSAACARPGSSPNQYLGTK